MLDVYYDQAGIPTIGWGHAIFSPSELHLFKNGITEEKANELFWSDVYPFVQIINKKVEVPLSQNMFDALVSFVFNVGINAFRKSTLLRELNKGNYLAVEGELKRWNKVTIDGEKVVSDGLANRREEEINYFWA